MLASAFNFKFKLYFLLMFELRAFELFTVFVLCHIFFNFDIILEVTKLQMFESEQEY